VHRPDPSRQPIEEGCGSSRTRCTVWNGTDAAAARRVHAFTHALIRSFMRLRDRVTFFVPTLDNRAIVEIGTSGVSTRYLSFGYVTDLLAFTMEGRTPVSQQSASGGTNGADIGVWRHRCGVLQGTQGGRVALANTFLKIYSGGSPDGSVYGAGDYTGTAETDGQPKRIQRAHAEYVCSRSNLC
jgi:hypothetical protein